MSENILLEGSDFTGKTTLKNVLSELDIPTQDRSPNVSSHMQLGPRSAEEYISAAAESIAQHHNDDLVVLLVAKDANLLAKRRDEIGAQDEYDIHAEAYNQLYQGLADKLTKRHTPNVVVIPIDDLTLHDTTRTVIEPWVQRHLDEFGLGEPTIEGRSKRIYHQPALGSLAVVDLIPSLFSITHNRYDQNVEGTDLLRTQFWALFGAHLNRSMSRYALDQSSATNKPGEWGQEEKQNLLDNNMIEKSYPFLSNYLGNVALGGRTLTVTRFADSLPPLEVVWKQRLVGTMKHTLLDVDKYPMRGGEHLQYDGPMPRDIIRFDWRNPVPDEQIAGKSSRPIGDEATSDDFADFYMHVHNAKQVARTVAHTTDDFLAQAGYQLVDTCYFLNEEGNLVYSEITPDGMRVSKKEKGGSYDKDLWRQGKDAATLRRVWGELLTDLRSVEY
ncbi:MAG TPA: phosphoribosylaminoimidazolesuccinocarboxamide synthase [Candidatus Saccharimonadales bacterium]